MRPLISNFKKENKDNLKVYLLGLREKEERLKICYNRLIEAGYKKEKIEICYGIYGKIDKDKLKSAKEKWHIPFNSKITSGEEACAISHLDTYQKILESRENFSLICEDDIIFPKKWEKIYEKAYDLIPDDAEIIYFGWGKELNSYPIIDISVPFIKYRPITTHCYLITKKAINKLIKINEKRGLNEPIDHWLIANTKEINVYCINPYFHDFYKNIKDDDYKYKSSKCSIDGIVYQDDTLGSSLSEERLYNRISSVGNNFINLILKPIYG